MISKTTMIVILAMSFEVSAFMYAFVCGHSILATVALGVCIYWSFYVFTRGKNFGE